MALVTEFDQYLNTGERLSLIAESSTSAVPPDTVLSFDWRCWPFSYTRRDLLLTLLSIEILRLNVHVNPTLDWSIVHTAPLDAVERWHEIHVFRPSVLVCLLEIAWYVSPLLAVWMYGRVKGDHLRQRLQQLILSSPDHDLLQCPYALQFIVGSANETAIFSPLWRSCNPIDALSYLILASGKRLNTPPSDSQYAYGRASAEPRRRRRFFSRTSQISKVSRTMSHYRELNCTFRPLSGRSSFHSPILMQYAYRSLTKCKPETVFLYIAQLVQACRYDTLGYAESLIVRFSKRSNLLAHQFIWNMETSCYFDDNTIDEVLKPKMLALKARIIKEAFNDDCSLSFYTRQFAFTDALVNVSGKLKLFAKGIERQRGCLECLRVVRLPEDGCCYLASNPASIVLDIRYDSAKPMQSAMKAPYRCCFDVKNACSYEEIDRLCKDSLLFSKLRLRFEETKKEKRKQHQNASSNAAIMRRAMFVRSRKSDEKAMSISNQEDDDEWINLMIPAVTSRMAIFKVGDDVRQDMLGLQLIRLFKSIFDKEGLDLFLYPYNVTATGSGRGVIECVPDSKSRDEIGRIADGNIFNYFVKTFGPVSSDEFQCARQNFIRSMAAYSIVLFILQVKDRHNGNIMISNRGHIIHIDFGFMFETSPGGNIGIEPDLKLTDEMIRLMGGRSESSNDSEDDAAAEAFTLYKALCVKAYLALRPYRKQICDLVAMMLDTKLPCFLGKTVELLNARFRPDLNDQQAANFLLTIIYNCTRALRTRLYDVFQYYQNQIPY